ncbi:hypothetical protein [Candidatus Nanopusillus massiliensis]|uniref:hypothetical protein n=1 Tax=Candidatus Nanopusillus massiliensis TaxID=2897163 RepID=UPI001E5E1F8A|nr:hypothetical protein [Candidatus Nanopusillus massiliensis]
MISLRNFNNIFSYERNKHRIQNQKQPKTLEEALEEAKVKKVLDVKPQKYMILIYTK